MKFKNLFFIILSSPLIFAGCTEHTSNNTRHDNNNHNEHNDSNAHPRTDEGANTATTADDSVKVETGLTVPEDAAEKEAKD